MQDPLPDKTVLLLIAGTLLVVFTMIYSFRPTQDKLGPSIQWRESPTSHSESLQI